MTPSDSISSTPRTSRILKTTSQSNPGLSFFCQPITSLSNKSTKTSTTTVTQPMVVSRFNLPRPNKEETKNQQQQNKPKINKVGGIGTFMLRGLLHSQKALDEAKTHQKIEDLETRKKLLLNLNQTLETAVKEQTDTIMDLQKRLDEIERPLTPGLDTASSKNGIMSYSEFEKLKEEEEAAFERIKQKLLQLAQQAQSAVISTETNTRKSRVIVKQPSSTQSLQRRHVK
ncbi:hypothetical protein G6F43_000203 [Rhizopus delemar]|nr:hypothetical protein G6F43_000203 [Rhizopus delemar]